MLKRLQLIEKVENNEKMDDDSLQQLKAWLYGKGGEEVAVFHWLESTALICKKNFNPLILLLLKTDCKIMCI